MAIMKVKVLKSGDMKQTGYFKKMISMQTEQLKSGIITIIVQKPVLFNLIHLEMLNTEI